MKTYRHLYDKFISDENIKLAIHKASKDKRDRHVVKKYLTCSKEVIESVRSYAINFETPVHTPVRIWDKSSKKYRMIVVPTFREQILHHMLATTLVPIIMKGMYKHNYAGVPGRGSRKARGAKRKQAKEFIEKWLCNDFKNTKYCFKMDIKKFFNSVPQDKLRAFISSIIKDEKFLRILFEEMTVKVDNKTDMVMWKNDIMDGLPLGFQTSHWLANWYLQSLDHYIKEELHAKYYVRWMDDIVVFGPNKRKLHKIQQEIERYLQTKLGLQMKENWQIFRMDYIKSGAHHGRFLDFMGFRFYRDRTTLRKSIMLATTRKAQRIRKKGYVTLRSARQMISYMGYIDCTDTYFMYQKHVKPYVNIQNCKRKIARNDRKRCKHAIEIQKSNRDTGDSAENGGQREQHNRGISEEKHFGRNHNRRERRKTSFIQLR